MKGRSGFRTEAMDKKEFVLKAVADKKDLIVEVSDKILIMRRQDFMNLRPQNSTRMF